VSHKNAEKSLYLAYVPDTLLSVTPTAGQALRPRAVDGRPYPEHLRAFEDYDVRLLKAFDEVDAETSLTFDQIAARLDDARLQGILGRWLTSAEWRGLVHAAEGTAPGSAPAYVRTAQVETTATAA
jgi:hypothetical protein